MVDAVLVEWEGVLADTFIGRRDALTRALSSEGVYLDDFVVAAECQGRSTHAAAAAVLARAGHDDPTLVDLVALRATRSFAERLGKGFVLRRGAREFMQHVQASAPIGLVTSASRSETEFVLRLAELDGAVSTVVCSDEGLDGPPHEALERAVANMARRCTLRRAHVVALAPSSRAVRAAKDAGVRVIAVGSPAHEALEADGVVEGVDGLTVVQLATIAGLPMLEGRR